MLLQKLTSIVLASHAKQLMPRHSSGERVAVSRPLETTQVMEEIILH